MIDYMGLNLRHMDTTESGGSSYLMHVGHAAEAIALGKCSVALITLAGRPRAEGMATGTAPRNYGSTSPDVAFEFPFGPTVVNMYAMCAMRHMHEYGTTSEQLAWIKVAASHHAQHNEHAMLRNVVTVEEVVNSPMISDPLHRLDCCVISDGGGAIVVVSPEVAKSLGDRAVKILGHGEAVKHLNAGTIDITYTGGAISGPRAYEEAGVLPGDIKYASIYDSFTITVVETIEDLGFCERGKGGAFVSDLGGHVIRTVSAGGAVATFVGSGTRGCQDGQGTAAQFNEPDQIACDADGNLYAADSGNNLIRKVTPGGLVSTFAGTGERGAKDGHCSEATFKYPTGVAVSPATGNIIVVDQLNHRVRVIVLPENIVYTLAGSTQGFADGIGAAAQFQHPFHVACDEAGGVYLTDFFNHRVRKITVADRAVTTLAGDGTGGHRDGAGAQARFDRPCGIAVDGGGNLLITENTGHRVRMITPAGATSTLAGDSTEGDADGQGAAARFDGPHGVAVDAAGSLLVADACNKRVRRGAAGLAPPAALRAPEPEAPTPEARILADYGKLLDAGEVTYHDVEFLVGGETVRAHKAILSSQCEYFATMLGSGFAEGTGGGGATSDGGGGAAKPAAPLPVADTTPAAFRAVLRFLYTSAVELEEASVLDVACLAQRYLVDELHERCVAYCAANASLANALPWLVVADTHAIAGLRATLLAYVADNLSGIEAASADTPGILQAHPVLMYAVLQAAASPPPAKRRKTGN